MRRLWRGVATGFALDEAGWARHANPWSVWTRVATLPVLVLAVWSRSWIGVWAALPVGLLILWTWWNPRAFPPPRDTSSRASRGVLGERLWLSLPPGALPPRHRYVPALLASCSLAGLAPLGWGLWQLDAWPTLFGLAWVQFGKLWFVDRMVWLFDDLGDPGAASRAPQSTAGLPPASGPPRAG